ncbi:2984_t:CDS:2, partial [Scutellospora calospora]
IEYLMKIIVQSSGLLLGRLDDMFKDTHIVSNALGSALLAGFKLICYNLSLPNINPGQLKPREDSKALGTPKVFCALPYGIER